MPALGPRPKDIGTLCRAATQKGERPHSVATQRARLATTTHILLLHQARNKQKASGDETPSPRTLQLMGHQTFTQHTASATRRAHSDDRLPVSWRHACLSMLLEQ